MPGGNPSAEIASEAEGKSPQNASPIVLRRNRQNILTYICCAKKKALERSFEVTRIFYHQAKTFIFVTLFDASSPSFR